MISTSRLAIRLKMQIQVNYRLRFKTIRIIYSYLVVLFINFHIKFIIKERGKEFFIRQSTYVRYER